MSETNGPEQLFSTDSMASETPSNHATAVPVDKVFRVYDQDQTFLMPPSLQDWLPEGHLAHFVSELVDDVLDLTPFYGSYVQAKGFPPYDPRLMLKLLLYGYTTGVRSSRKIELRCHEDVAFRFLAANVAPDFRSIARFRKRHLEALGASFLEALKLCQKAGMVKMGRVALDGTKVKANASRHKAMSYDRMVTAEQKLQDEVDDLLADAQRVDDEEDAEYGIDNRVDDLQGEMARRESRLAKVRKAKADLEQEARDKAETKAREKAAKNDLTEQEAEEAATKALESAEPKPKAQRNFTDEDARIMKTSDGSYHYCYNPQAVVDEDNQVIVATDFAASSADNPAFVDLLDQTITNTGQTPKETLADAGYFSDDNEWRLLAACHNLRKLFTVKGTAKMATA